MYVHQTDISKYLSFLTISTSDKKYDMRACMRARAHTQNCNL